MSRSSSVPRKHLLTWRPHHSVLREKSADPKDASHCKETDKLTYFESLRDPARTRPKAIQSKGLALVAEQALDRPDSEKQRRWICHCQLQTPMMMENLLNKKKMLTESCPPDLGRLEEFALLREGRTENPEWELLSSTPRERGSGGEQSLCSIWRRHQDRWQRWR